MSMFLNDQDGFRSILAPNLSILITYEANNKLITSRYEVPREPSIENFYTITNIFSEIEDQQSNLTQQFF